MIQKKPPRVKDEYYDWVEEEYQDTKIREAEIMENPDQKGK